MSMQGLPTSSEHPALPSESPRSRRSGWLRALLPLLAIGLGVGVFVLLVKTKPQAPRAEHDVPAPLVETLVAHAETHAVQVEADGTVVPARKVGLAPQVAGRVVWTSPQLEPGGRVRRGEPLVRIEQKDYRLALQAARAQVAQAELQLRIESRRKDLAEREWARYGHDGEGDVELARRDPQLQTARAALEAARGALERAKLNLSRAVLSAPFDAVVVESKAEVGQLLGPQAGSVVTLVGTEHFWVQVSVPVGVLPSIALPSEEESGAAVVVRHHTGQQVVERRGRVLRLLPDLARGGSMARLLVEIDDPLGAERPGEPPLLLGAFVRVRIEASPLESVFALPRAALREGDRVFLVSEESRLQVRPVQVAWRDERTVYVSGGLQEGERVVTSSLSTPVSGMKLRVAPEGDRGEVARREAGSGTEAAR